MNHLDEELRRALRREEPPAGFAERLLERLPAATPPVVVPMPARGRAKPRFALVAAALLVAATGGVAFVAIPRSNMPKDISEAGRQAPPLLPDPTPPAQEGPPVVEPAPEPGGPPSTHYRRPVRRATQRVDDEAGRKAVEQLRLALHITGDKLNVARREAHETLAVPQS
jgi:hypothetical protein